jgi:hypothetical protein
VSWRRTLVLACSFGAAVVLGLVRSGPGHGTRQVVAAIAGAVLIGIGVIALIVHFAGATAAHIEASNRALRALAGELHLTYRDLPDTARSGRQPYGLLTGRYRGAEVEIGLSGYHGGTPLSTCIRVVDFPSLEQEPLLRAAAEDHAEIDLPRSSGQAPAANSPRQLKEAVAQLAGDAKFLVFDRGGLHLYVNPHRHILAWLTDFTDFDIETDPARLRSIVDHAVGLREAFKRDAR